MSRADHIMRGLIDLRVPQEIAQAFDIMRARRLVTQTRYLYVGLLVTVLPAMVSSSDAAPFWATTVLPLVIGAFLLVGFVTLLPVKPERISARKARRFIFDATWSSPLVAALCSLWCVVNWSYAPDGMRAYYPLILSMGSLATAYCLSSIRMAAILNMVIGLLPISLLMLFSGQRMDMVSAVCMLVAATFLLQMIFDQQRQWLGLLLLEQEMRVQARTDPLTGLLNRRAIAEKLDQRLADPASEPFNLALVDLDGFKQVNDSHGHALGDQLLCAVGQRLIAAAGQGADVARIGGDEFAILMPSQSALSAQAIPGVLLSALVAPYAIGDRSVRIGGSAGVARWPDDGSAIEALLEKADKALYAVKAARPDGRRSARSKAA
jgi:diguanylate cyclase